MIFFKNLFKGVELATLSFKRYNMAQGLLRRSCFKYLNIMEKTFLEKLTFFCKLHKKNDGQFSYFILKTSLFEEEITKKFLEKFEILSFYECSQKVVMVKVVLLNVPDHHPTFFIHFLNHPV